VSLSSLDLYYRRSATGPGSGYWQYELNGGAWTTIRDVPNEFSSTSSSGAAMAELDLSGVGGLQNLAAGMAVVLRLVPYGASGSAGTWYVYDQPGTDLVVNGTTQGPAGGPGPNAGGADLADVLLTAGRRQAAGVADRGVPGYTVPFIAAPSPSAPPVVAGRAPGSSFGVPAAHAASFTQGGKSSLLAANDLFWALDGDADVTEKL
jgi:hypothetical protein